MIAKLNDSGLRRSRWPLVEDSDKLLNYIEKPFVGQRPPATTDQFIRLLNSMFRTVGSECLKAFVIRKIKITHIFNTHLYLRCFVLS